MAPPTGSTPESTTALGEELAALRARRGLSRRALSVRAGLDPGYLHYVERGGRHPDRAHVLRLARALDLDAAAADRLLVAAGFAPRALASVLNAPELAELDDLIGASPPELQDVLKGMAMAAVAYGRQQYARTAWRAGKEGQT